MRIMILSMLALFLLACNKDKENGIKAEDNTTGVIEGTWELRESNGGMSPYTVYPPGNGNLLSFDGDSYKMIASGQVQHQGPYSLVNDSVTNVNTCTLEPPPSEAPNRVIFDNEVFLRRGFVVTGNTLTISIGCIPADGGYTKYRRIEAAGAQ